LGKAETLKSLAAARFGRLSEEDLRRIDRADVETLDCWVYKLLGARSLDDLFATNP